MDQVLHIGDLVVTEDLLQRRHHGETDVHICRRAVITPTGWDYIRDHRLRVTRVEGVAALSSRTAPGRPGGRSSAIPEITPPSADDTSLVQRGRCEFPSRSFGCKTEEFGSGFVEPSTCQECSLPEKTPTASGGACGGCNRHRTLQRVAGEGRGAAPDLEALVQQITEEIMSRLGSS